MPADREPSRRAAVFPTLGRLLVFLLLWLLLPLGFEFLNGGLGGAGGALLVTTLAALGGVVLLQRLVRGPSLGDLGLRWQGAESARQALAGLALGPLLLLLLFVLQWAARWLSVGSGDLRAGEAAPWLLAFALVALNEELVARGYVLQSLERIAGTLPALVISAAFWGLLHAGNPGVTPLAVANIAAAGLLFGYAYLLTRSLWLPMALHLSWNAAEGLLFGYPVSGLATPALLRTSVGGPGWLTGAAFGPEGGLLLFVALGAGAALLWAWARARTARARAGGGP